MAGELQAIHDYEFEEEVMKNISIKEISVLAQTKKFNGSRQWRPKDPNSI